MPKLQASNPQPSTSGVQILGIRHHGPGSARSVRQALEAMQPDIILVEGPPDGDGVLPLLTHAEMKPPVALLIYAVDDPKQAVFYPFAVFSPEWQAIQFGLKHEIPVRFMDLPQAHQLAVVHEPQAQPADQSSNSQSQIPDVQSLIPDPRPLTAESQPLISDPLHWLAQAAGFEDSERWWEYMVEHRRDTTDVFAAILEAMAALRSSGIGFKDLPADATTEVQREAYMRQTIRAAQKEGFQKIAVVCGAWHGPALAEMPPARADAEVLKGLPKVKVNATWVPWTYSRLSFQNGYGAGVESPGWYHHLWHIREASGQGVSPTTVTIRWMSRVAQLMRDEDLQASVAHIIEAVRLAESLATLRGRPLPGLAELNEAAQAIMCFGSDAPMRLIHEKLVVGELLGTVPDETPMVPLQQDLQREQKRLRLQPEAAHKDIDLDLRKPNDLERSHVLHRLNLLEIPWGVQSQVHGKSGTFHEQWRLQWKPEFSVRVIEVAVWGNSIVNAATAYVRHLADLPDPTGAMLPRLTTLLNQVLLANLPEAIGHLMERVQNEAALASDVTHLMQSLPALANIVRYGNVRQTDVSAVGHVVDGMVARVCVGLPGACASLDDAAAAVMFDHIANVNRAVSLLQNEEHLSNWHSVLRQIADQQGVHGLVAGRCARLLLDAHFFTAEDTARRMSLALSVGNDPAHAAAWVEGFLKGSGLLLLHDTALWNILDRWVTTLHGDMFLALLPLLCRTFSTFTVPERRQMGERVRRGLAVDETSPGQTVGMSSTNFDTGRAEQILPLAAQLLGM